jgi:SAM-dependent methyltransferase
MKISNFNKIKNHFENATEDQLRGENSQYSINIYALFILSKLEIIEGRILDLGCGDGKIIQEIQRINPNLTVDGVEISTDLYNKAKLRNPKSEIFNSNALTFNTNKKYDRIFSFSFAQYLSGDDLLLLNIRLLKNLKYNQSSKIIHLSIPDWRLNNANYYVEYAKKDRTPLFPLRFILNLFNIRRLYGIDGGRYHSPHELCRAHKNHFSINVSSKSDSYYRFDIKLSPLSQEDESLSA